MLDDLLQIIAPHLCFGCQKTGALLCHNCKYNIESEPFSGCISCRRAVTSNTGICGDCKACYTRAWCVGERTETLARLIDGYKFHRARAGYRVLAELLDARLPQLPPETIVVPVPTIASHIRQRGYDHTLLVARELAKKRRLALNTSLQRATTTVQLGSSRQDRLRQAKEAFMVKGSLKDRPHLLIDDVITTGATVDEAAKRLRHAGVPEVWLGVVARQPLD